MAAARMVPWASCLVQALAADRLLTEMGYASRLQLGVAYDETRSLLAHAWVELDDVIVVGGSEQGRFHVLPPLVERP